MKYLLIGNGRVARHMRHYFDLLGLDYLCWHRDEGELCLQALLPASTHLLFLISDQAIEPFIREHVFLPEQVLIHFSGALLTPFAHAAHPLNTFGPKLHEIEHYQRLPFIVDESGPPFSDLLPGLPNQSHRLSSAKRPLYHALCVMAGNFTVLLWQKAFADFESELALPKSCLYEYLKTTTDNLLRDSDGALSGPLARKDTQTLQKNLESLSGDPYQSIYQAFMKVTLKG